jgi:hypothetical protein
MNERFAIEPESCRSGIEWQLLLDKFGPLAGRYVVRFPHDWEARVCRDAESNSWCDAARLRTVFRRAHEHKKILSSKVPSKYIDGKAWHENIRMDSRLAAELGGIIVRKGQGRGEIEIDSLSLPPTAGEHMSSTVANFKRVSEVLLTFSPELYLVDPYLNVTRSDCFDVLVGIFEVASRGPCRKIVAWCSERHVDVRLEAIRDALKKIKIESGFPHPVTVHVANDKYSKKKLHNRWLFTQYGGVEFGQGFQCPPSGMEVRPMDKSHLDDCWERFREGRGDFTLSTVSE